MTEYNNIIETSEKDVLKSARKWESICKISNVILSLIYIPTGVVFGVLGLLFLSLGFSENSFSAICAFVSSATFLLTPIFCVIGIVLSVIFRKKKSLYASFLIQFLPFCTLGIAVFAFFLSLFLIFPLIKFPHIRPSGYETEGRRLLEVYHLRNCEMLVFL